ncbi:MAG: SDR family oxidoreductase [Bacilli bacterium]|nr:SDR family oxidoreductase [Bacilli bacterium]MDD4808769.1 SDR family oxidoreductase [Bacilli bacterium]
MKILILGSTGMLGHVVKLHFEKQGYEVFTTTRDKNNELYFDPMDNISDFSSICNKINPQVVINCIGILNKDAEENKAKAVLINSYLPHYLDELTDKLNFKLIHVSTDCVFNGEKGKYSEDSQRDADNFYGQSKALGEINNNKNLTLRTSIIGPDNNPNGIGLFQWFINQQNQVGGYSKVMWTGVTTIQLAKSMEEAIKNNLVGLYHVVNNSEISKLDLLKLFKKYFNKDIKILENENVISNKTLIVTRQDYKFNVPTYDEMIEDMQKWVIEYSDLYPNITNKCKVLERGKQ